MNNKRALGEDPRGLFVDAAELQPLADSHQLRRADARCQSKLGEIRATFYHKRKRIATEMLDFSDNLSYNGEKQGLYNLEKPYCISRNYAEGDTLCQKRSKNWPKS